MGVLSDARIIEKFMMKVLLFHHLYMITYNLPLLI